MKEKFNKHQLIQRGWNKDLIDTFLGKPDTSSKAGMYVHSWYDGDHVRESENTNILVSRAIAEQKSDSGKGNYKQHEDFNWNLFSTQITRSQVSPFQVSKQLAKLCQSVPLATRLEIFGYIQHPLIDIWLRTQGLPTINQTYLNQTKGNLIDVVKYLAPIEHADLELEDKTTLKTYALNILGWYSLNHIFYHNENFFMLSRGTYNTIHLINTKEARIVKTFNTAADFICYGAGNQYKDLGVYLPELINPITEPPEGLQEGVVYKNKDKVSIVIQHGEEDLFLTEDNKIRKFNLDESLAGYQIIGTILQRQSIAPT
jgi:hypothetical protein